MHLREIYWWFNLSQISDEIQSKNDLKIQFYQNDFEKWILSNDERRYLYMNKQWTYGLGNIELGGMLLKQGGTRRISLSQTQYEWILKIISYCRNFSLWLILDILNLWKKLEKLSNCYNLENSLVQKSIYLNFW